MIKLLVIGHLGKDATVNDVNSKTVINFTIAHSEKFKDQQGNQKEKTTWIECAYWTDKTAIAPYLKKGTQVYLEGIPEAGSYVNKEGQTVTQLKLRVSQVQLLGGGQREDNSQQTASTTSHNHIPDNAETDPLPF